MIYGIKHTALLGVLLSQIKPISSPSFPLKPHLPSFREFCCRQLKNEDITPCRVNVDSAVALSERLYNYELFGSVPLLSTYLSRWSNMFFMKSFNRLVLLAEEHSALGAQHFDDLNLIMN